MFYGHCCGPAFSIFTKNTVINLKDQNIRYKITKNVSLFNGINVPQITLEHNFDLTPRKSNCLYLLIIVRNSTLSVCINPIKKIVSVLSVFKTFPFTKTLLINENKHIMETSSPKMLDRRMGY